MKTKIISVNTYPKYTCIKDTEAKYNQYKVYRLIYNKGWHREKVYECNNIQSALFTISEMTRYSCEQ